MVEVSDKSAMLLEHHKHGEYNDEPVVYCADCLSLNILTIDGIDYCEKCGSTSTKEANIFDWENMYRDKYKKNHINR